MTQESPKFFDHIERQLAAEPFTVDGVLQKYVVINHAQNGDEALLKLLLEDDVLKNKFFKDIAGALVFDHRAFVWYLEQKNYLNDSYTRYKNKIGLTVGGKYLKQRNEVALVWPFKDCCLEGGQSREEQKRPEIFFNEVLAQDEITQLLWPKALTAAAVHDKSGKRAFKAFARDAELNKSRDLPADTITDNLLIKGNNLLALHSLKEQFAGRVKLIYIDPPYNTGNDSFNYNDRFTHSTWLTFMRNRLDVARKLLRDDGAIFVQCDDNEQAYLKVLMDEVFGRDNFMNLISVRTGDSLRAIGGGESKNLIKKAEFLMFFVKEANSFSLNKCFEYTSLKDVIAQKKREKKNFEYNKVLVSYGTSKPYKSFKDGTGKNVKIRQHKGYKILSIAEFKKEKKIADESKVYSDFSEKVVRLAVSQSSIFKKVQQLTDKGLYSIEYVPVSGKRKGMLTERFFFRQNEVVFLNQTLEMFDGEPFRKVPLSNLWTDVSWHGIMNEGLKFPNGKKPEKLIQKIIDLSTKEGDIVLDYHLGSGTTVAVAHKMGRQYIGIEQLDYVENTAIDRLKNVIHGEQGGVSSAVKWNGGGKFVYFELKKHNQKFMDAIQAAKTPRQLLAVWNDMKANSFLDYNLDMKAQAAHMAEFKQLSLAEQKRHLCEILDKNQLYVNLASLNDRDRACTAAEKKLTADFYQTGKAK